MRRGAFANILVVERSRPTSTRQFSFQKIRFIACFVDEKCFYWLKCQQNLVSFSQPARNLIPPRQRLSLHIFTNLYVCSSSFLRRRCVQVFEQRGCRLWGTIYSFLFISLTSSPALLFICLIWAMKQSKGYFRFCWEINKIGFRWSR